MRFCGAARHAHQGAACLAVPIGGAQTCKGRHQINIARVGHAGRQRFDIAVTYKKKLDPVLGLPTPTECEAEVQAIVAARKINFEPGSATPVGDAAGILDDIAAVLNKCSDFEMEISGYTDSQGREEMNKALSQERADAVLRALRDRRVASVSLTATGYGEIDPVAGNDSEEGREANRRIEFKLIKAQPVNNLVDTLLENAEKSDANETPMGLTEEEEQQKTDTPASEGAGN